MGNEENSGNRLSDNNNIKENTSLKVIKGKSLSKQQEEASFKQVKA
jgi:hypothetical protein